MRTNAFPFRFVLCALCAIGLWGAPAFSQRIERGFESETAHPSTTESNTGKRPEAPATHALHDWTHSHMLYPRVGPMDRLIKIQKDPRAIQHWQEGFRKDYERWRHGGEGHRSLHHNHRLQRDWNIGIGGVVDDAMYPAKWTFDINETVPTTNSADAGVCLNDYLVAAVDASGVGGTGVGQPNIVGLNNLYSGTAPGPTGVCNRLAPAIDDGVSATQYFSYSVIGPGIDGTITTSPVTSMDGALIAFVEQGFGPGAVPVGARFHVLAWNAHDGNSDGTTGRQDVLSGSLQITTFATSTPLTPGTATDLALGAFTDTLSSPYVEYTDDLAYVGDDGGNIYRIKNVFCPAWQPCGGAAPSLDGSWGTGGVVNVGAACTVSGITVDGASGNIFAGCSNGFLYSIAPTGATPTVTSLQVGDGTAIGGINDPPSLDVVNGWVYVETGSCVGTLTGCTAGSPVVVQASIANLATNTVASIGPATINLIHAPAFNDAYFSSATAADWLMYEFSSDTGGGGEIVLYGITFGSSPTSHTMTAGTPPNTNVLAFPGTLENEVSPLSEFLVGSGGATSGPDFIFASQFVNAGGNIVEFPINNPPTTASVFPTAPPTVFAQEGIGTSGIVVDNIASGSNQANSIYFGTLGTGGVNSNSLVKLTQALFQ